MVRLLLSMHLKGAFVLAGLMVPFTQSMANDIDMGDHINGEHQMVKSTNSENTPDRLKLLAEGFRGIIDGDDANLFVDSIKAGFEPERQKEEALQQDSSLAEPAHHAAIEQIDHVITGVSDPNAQYTKFNAAGEPMKHHQDYPRHTIKSLTSRFFNAMDINPYPGTD